jgi:pyrroloquinoline quinone biosynthesis protein D
MISSSARPRLASKARLRFDRKSTSYMLLYPEKGLVLNPTSADILKLCTGEHTVAAIVQQLAEKYSKDAPDVEPEVVAFLRAMADRGLVHDAP